MTVYLDPQQVAERLCVTRRTAMSLMMEMNPTPICGKVRMRYRVSEENLNRWMAKKAVGKPISVIKGSNKKLGRR